MSTKTKIVGNAVVITSSLKADEILKVKKFTKSGLKLRDEKGNEIFSIDYRPGVESSISEYGVIYGETNAEGYAQISLLMAEEVKPEDRMGVLLDNYAIALGNLNTLETYIRETATELTATVEDIKNGIEVID
jgi:IMP cyclohydrolase